MSGHTTFVIVKVFGLFEKSHLRYLTEKGGWSRNLRTAKTFADEGSVFQAKRFSGGTVREVRDGALVGRSVLANDDPQGSVTNG